MNEQHKEIIKNVIQKNFSLEEKFSDFELNSNFQLLLSQLDLFKTMSALVIGLIGIGYFYNTNLDINFLTVSFAVSIFTLFLLISYTRETIDAQSKLNKQTNDIIRKNVRSVCQKCLEALQKDNSEIFFKYNREKLNKEHSKSPPLNYMGEIATFLFYLSVGFLILSFFAKIYSISLISWQTAVVTFFAYILSYKNWTIKFVEISSKNVSEIIKN